MNSRNPANRFSQAKPTYVEGADGTRSWYVDKDKLGRFFKVYRVLHVHRHGRNSWLARAAFSAKLAEFVLSPAELAALDAAKTRSA